MKQYRIQCIGLAIFGAFVCLSAVTIGYQWYAGAAERKQVVELDRHLGNRLYSVTQVGRLRPRVVELSVWFSKVPSDDEIRVISECRHLRSLTLEGIGLKRGGEIDGDRLVQLASAPNLISLELCGFPINHKDIQYLGQLHQLRHLMISHTVFDDLEVEQLCRLTQLQSLRLYDCELSDSNVELIRQRLPIARIEFSTEIRMSEFDHPESQNVPAKSE